jgi:methionyl-tRNA synthetase
MLKAEGSFILPDNVPANEFLNLEGNKISTSQNWAVWLHEYLEEFPGKQDVLRYTLCSIMPETKDSDFTWKDFQAKNNSELLAIFGNFVNRTMVLVNNYYNGNIPLASQLREDSVQVFSNINALIRQIDEALEQFRFREAQNLFMDIARAGNKYLTENEPWKKIKEYPSHAAETLSVSAQIMAKLAIISEPFLPFSSEKLFGMLNLNKQTWDSAFNNILLPANQHLGKPSFLFERIEEDVISFQIEKLRKTAEENKAELTLPVEPPREHISYDDFLKMDIRISTILEAEKVPKTKKLMKLLVDTGLDKRTIVSGIADQYDPESIIGKQVIVLANLAPRDLKGITSHGMILLAEDSKGKLIFVTPDTFAQNGSTVK